jgi:ElaB/YqjD/DUF883 family membrane-anchored ribosome-binding protein
LAAIKEKTTFFTVIYNKFDSTLDKLHELMEERRSDTNDDLKDVYRKIEGVENKIMSEIEKMREDMRAQHDVERKKIEDLNKWRWLVVGGASVLGWLLSKAVTVLSGPH